MMIRGLNKMNVFHQSSLTNYGSTNCSNLNNNLIESIDNWCELATKNIIPLSYEQDNPRLFRGNLKSQTVGNLQVAHITATPHTVHRTKTMIQSTENKAIVFNLLLTGHCTSEQDGQSSSMSSNSSWFCNASRPYSLQFSDDFV